MAKKKTEKKKKVPNKKNAKPKGKADKKVLSKKTVAKKAKLKTNPQRARKTAKPKPKTRKARPVAKKTSKSKKAEAKSKTSKTVVKTKPVKAPKKMLKVVRTPLPAAPKGNKSRETPAPPKSLDPVLLKIRERLLASRGELFKIIESSQEMERNVSELTFSNEIDLASSLEGREMVFQLASRDRNELKLIDDALFKMAKGAYGVCEGCAKQIGLKRLQIMPLTQFCIECQESMEGR